MRRLMLLKGIVLLAGIAFVAGSAAACGRSESGADPEPIAAAAAAAPTEYLYVTSQSGPAVSIIDMDAREVVETIWLTELGFTANAKPHHVAVAPDGETWYVSLIADGFVLKFNRDNELLGRAEYETPGLLALDPVEDVLYVGRSMAAVNPPHRIGVIQRSDMSIEEYDVFFPRPHAIAAGRGGGRLYTASLAVNQMASLSPEDDDLEVINIPGDTHTFVNFAISPDGGTMVAGGQVSGQVIVFDLADPTSPELTYTLHVGGEPWHPVYSPDGSLVYFPQRTANSVAVIDTGSWEVVATIEGDGLAEPHGAAISADGRTLWIAGRNTRNDYTGGHLKRTSDLTSEDPLPAGTVVAIDTESHQIIDVLDVPAYAAGMATR